MLAAAAALLLLASCTDFSFFSVMDGQIAGGALQISPVAITLVVGTTCTFSARGGSPPYSFSLVSGSGSIDADSGQYTAPGFPASDYVQVQDSQGAVSQAVVTVIIE
jgi:hypothetical protein